MSRKKINNGASDRRKASVASRIGIVRGRLNRVEFAALLNVSPAYITMIEQGKRSPGASLTELICLKFSVNREWLISGKGLMPSQVSARAQWPHGSGLDEGMYGTVDAVGNQYARAAEPVIDWRGLEAGDGTHAGHEPQEMTSVNVYRLELLKDPDNELLRAPVDTLIVSGLMAKAGPVAFKVSDAGMGDTIRDGAIAGIQYRNLSLRDGAIYIVRTASGSVIVRRIFKGNNALIMRPDNPQFPELTAGAGDVTIIGRVAWVMQAL
ncbi:MAG: LexA family transcriptional regulator [Deltaproteobacteria bacterium]